MSLSNITLCKISRVLLLSAGFLVTVPSAWAQAKGDDRQWYLTLNGGWLGLRDASASLEPPSAPSRSGDLKLGGGTQFGGTLGYRINSSWRVEGEITYRSSSIDSTTVAGLDASQSDADLASLAIMFNGLYDFQGWKTSFAHFRPYVGAGLGLAQEIDSDLKIGGTKREFSGNRVAYQLMTGVNWYYRSGWFAGAGLKWFDAGKASLEGTPSSLGKLKVDYSGLSAEISIGYRF